MTLIEVLVAMVLMSILLVSYVMVFSNGFVFLKSGEKMTQDTFDHQAIMEKLYSDGKKAYDSLPQTPQTITLFSGDYEANIAYKSLTTQIDNNRFYKAYISNVVFNEPPAPVVDPFEVAVYQSGTTTSVFPWYEDDIEIRATYNLKADPQIYQNRERWYASNIDEVNPYFPSGFTSIYEFVEDTPIAGYRTSSLTKVAPISQPLKKVEGGRYYYFELRPYTFAGRLAEYYNDERILILSKNGSDVWQQLFEDIYFNRSKVFKSEVYTEIFNNSTYPTLNLDWKTNADPQGALLGIPLPVNYLDKNFKVEVPFGFRIIKDTTGISELGVGMGLMDNANTGVMLTFDPLKNQIRVNAVQSGGYTSLIATLSLLTDSRFQPLWIQENGNTVLDYALDYSMELDYVKTDNKLLFKLKQLGTTSKVSEIVEIPLTTAIDPEYVGLKSYSSISYIPDSSYEIVGKYDRNASSFFYDVLFSKGAEVKGFDYVIYAPNALNAQHAFETTGSLYSKETLTLKPSSAKIAGNIVSEKDIIIEGAGSSAVIYKNVYAPNGTVYFTDGGGTVQGEVHAFGKIKIGTGWNFGSSLFTLDNVVFYPGANKIRTDIHSFNEVEIPNGNISWYLNRNRYFYGNDPNRLDPTFPMGVYLPPSYIPVSANNRVVIGSSLTLQSGINQFDRLGKADMSDLTIKLNLSSGQPIKVLVNGMIDLRSNKISVEVMLPGETLYRKFEDLTEEKKLEVASLVYWQSGERFILQGYGSATQSSGYFVGTVLSPIIDLANGGFNIYGCLVATDYFAPGSTQNTKIHFAPFNLN